MLITGLSTVWGGTLARILERDPEIETVIGVDRRPPKVELERMSNRLHDTLREPSASEADIARQIDSISAKEATIRKVRILAWVKARNMLRKDQRQQVEAAAKKHH